MSAAATPILNKISCGARNDKPAAMVIGRISPLRRVLPAFGSPTKNTLGIVGSPGGGALKEK
jgi:hypothetical protein